MIWQFYNDYFYLSKMYTYLIFFFKFQLQRSDEKNIYLWDLHVDMTGTYTCEVSTEGTFETVKETAKMNVIGKKPITYTVL